MFSLDIGVTFAGLYIVKQAPVGHRSVYFQGLTLSEVSSPKLSEL